MGGGADGVCACVGGVVVYGCAGVRVDGWTEVLHDGVWRLGVVPVAQGRACVVLRFAAASD